MTALWQTIETTAHRLSTARPGYVLAALALYIISLFIVGYRWRGFLRAFGGEVGVLRSTLATLGGISVGNLTPSSRLAGEACRIALVRLGGNATWGQTTIAAVWDRLSEVPPILVLTAMALFAVRRLGSGWRTGVTIAGIGLLVAAGGYGIVRVRRADGLQLVRWRERLALDRVTPRVFAIGVACSTALWLQDVLRLMCVSGAFNVTLSAPRVATLAMLAMVGSWVPTVGGLGAIEGGLVAGLVAFGVDLPTAAAITAAERAISYGFSTTSGALVVVLLGGRSLAASLFRPARSAADA